MNDPGPSQAAAPVPPTIVCPGVVRQRDPAIFSGAEDLDVEDWLAEYARVSAYNKWADRDKLTNVGFYLTGVANLWFRNHETSFTTWSAFASTLTEVFGRPAVRRLRAEQRLRGRVQRTDESFTSYIEDVLSLCRRVNSSMDEADKIKHVMKGVDDHAFQMLVAKSPQTVAEVIQLCQEYDELRKQRATTRCAAQQDTADLAPLDFSRDAADISALMPQIQQFIRQEVARQLSLATSPPEPVTSLAPSLRQVLQTQVAEALPAAPHPQPVVGPLTYANVVARPYAPPAPDAYRTTGTFHVPPPPSRPVPVPYSAAGAPVVNPWRTPDNRPICYSCGFPGHVARFCRRRNYRFPDSGSASGYMPARLPRHDVSNLPPDSSSSRRPFDSRRSPSPRRRSLSPMVRRLSPAREEN